MTILRKLANFPDPTLDRQITDMVIAINRLTSGDIGAEVAGVAADLDAQHIVDFAHDDIAHANRADLDSVQGVNTGDQDLTYLEEGIADVVADVVTVTADVVTGAGNLAGHESDTGNPHGVTAAQAGAVPALEPYTVNAACTDEATAIALVNQIRLALISNDICV